MLSDLTGSGKFNMAASKAEVSISKLVDKIGTKVEWLQVEIYIFPAWGAVILDL